MNAVGKWFKQYFPGIWTFIAEFFDAMNTRRTGQSLRKWLAVGFFWLMAKLALEHTTNDTLVSVLTVLASMITALIITYSITGNAGSKRSDTNDAEQLLAETKNDAKQILTETNNDAEQTLAETKNEQK